MSFEEYEVNRLPYPSSLFNGLPEKDLRILEKLANSKDLLEKIDDLKCIIKDAEGRLYLLFRLFIKKINPNFNNGITGISIDYDKYYKMTEYLKKEECYKPSKAANEVGKLSKDKIKEIKKEDGYIINRSDLCYTKILSYDKFELSNNIAYEFAKRSKYPFAEIELIYLYKKILLSFLDNEYQADLRDDIFQIEYFKNEILEDNNFLDLVHFLKSERTTLETIYNDFSSYTKTIREFSTSEEYYLHSWQFYDAIPEGYLKIMQEDIIRPNFKSALLPESEEFVFNFRINMALPEDELLEYIKKVRRELFRSEKMDDINILELIFGKREDYRIVIGDMLFMYDAIRVGMKNNHILDSLESYSILNSMYQCTKDIKTLKRYFQYAKLLIEEEYYRAFISPIHNNDIRSRIDTIKNDKKI